MGVEQNRQLQAADTDILCAVSSPSRDDPLLVQAHGWTLVHAHIRITKKSASTALDSPGVQGMQVLGRHLQVLAHFRAGGHLGNVEAILTTIPVGHAVKEEPGRIIFPVLHKGDIMACFYAEHSKQLHLLAGDEAVSPVPVGQIFGERHWVIFMIQPLGMKVDLSVASFTKLLDLSSGDVRIIVALSTLIHREPSADPALSGSIFK